MLIVWVTAWMWAFRRGESVVRLWLYVVVWSVWICVECGVSEGGGGSTRGVNGDAVVNVVEVCGAGRSLGGGFGRGQGVAGLNGYDLWLSKLRSEGSDIVTYFGVVGSMFSLSLFAASSSTSRSSSRI